MKRIFTFTLSLIATYTIAQDCSDLFISEYVEGSHNNKALEIYNPTSTDIILDGVYDLVRYSNGATESIESDIQYVQPLTGTVPAHGTYIALVDRRDPNGTGQDTILFSDLLSIGNNYPNAGFYSLDYNSGTAGSNVMVFNGDDALGLRKNGVKVDIFGKIGQDPGLSWTDDPTASFADDNGGTWWTRNKTLVRKPSVKKGVTASPILFDPTVEWDSLSVNTFNGLGSHYCDCSTPSYVLEQSKNIRLYPNPSSNDQVVMLQSEGPLGTIHLTNSLGQTIRKFKSELKIITLNTHQLAVGTYFIHVSNLGEIWKEKLIIK